MLNLIEIQLKNAISIVGDFKLNDKNKMIDITNSILNLLNDLPEEEEEEEEEDYDDDSDSDSDAWSDTNSDASFTEEEETFIQNEAHREYLKRYSLKPRFHLHYFNADRDKDNSQ
jgi:hypothetical protein